MKGNEIKKATRSNTMTLADDELIEAAKEQFVTDVIAQQILGKSAVSLWRYRRDGLLPYRQVQGKGRRGRKTIYYKLTDLMNLGQRKDAAAIL